MDDLLNTKFIDYINSSRSHIVACSPIRKKDFRSDVIDDVAFDIQDPKAALIPTIKQPLGAGSATYDNPNRKIIAFIDYDNFLSQLPLANTKGMKRADFIAYDLEQKTFFIVNELSQSRSTKVKLSDAKQQLHDVIHHFHKVPDIKEFIEAHTLRLCVLSNRQQPIQTPNGMANAFGRIATLLPLPNKLDYQPITSLGFELWVMSLVKV